MCYHTGDARDYAAHGFAETVKVTLDAASAEKQLAALAKDFFGSFTGEAGQRVRPDPGDRGGAYRSVFGLPGGMASPLYKVFKRENAFRMLLKPGAGKNDGAGDPPRMRCTSTTRMSAPSTWPRSITSSTATFR